jgi:hypothetical protein
MPILHGNLSSNLQILWQHSYPFRHMYWVHGITPPPQISYPTSQIRKGEQVLQLNSKMELPGLFCTKTTLYLWISKRQHLSTPNTSRTPMFHNSGRLLREERYFHTKNSQSDSSDWNSPKPLRTAPFLLLTTHLPSPKYKKPIRFMFKNTILATFRERPCLFRFF